MTPIKVACTIICITYFLSLVQSDQKLLIANNSLPGVVKFSDNFYMVGRDFKSSIGISKTGRLRIILDMMGV